MFVNNFSGNTYPRQSQWSLSKGHRTKWCSYVRMNLSWETLLAMPQQLLTFCFGATYDTLPSHFNLHHWHINPEASCLLCKKQVCTTAHVLGACTVALFWHDSVWRVLVVALESFLSSKKSINAQSNNSINLLKLVQNSQNIQRGYILGCYILQLIGSY